MTTPSHTKYMGGHEYDSMASIPGAHKRKERVTSILYRSNQEVKSSASGCGVTQLNDYHIRLVCCSTVVMTRNPYELMGSWLWSTHSKRTVFDN